MIMAKYVNAVGCEEISDIETFQWLASERARSADERLCERQILALHLLVERQKGAKSKWQPFISSIPTAYSTLEYWRDEVQSLSS